MVSGTRTMLPHLHSLLLAVLLVSLKTWQAQSSSPVISVNTSNSHTFLSNKDFLLEFYAPWCGHCQTFMVTYKSIAVTLSPGIKVGNVDSSANPALAARFDVTSIPCLFLYREGKMWKYEGALLRDPIVDWAQNSFKTKPAISFLTSPMGAMGQSKGTLIRIGDSVMQSLPLLTKKFGLPKWAGFVFVALALGFAILFVILAIVYCSLHHKMD